MNKIIQKVAFTVMMCILSDCGTSSSSKNDPPVIATVSDDCSYGIETFNSAASGNVMREIAAIHSKYGRIPEDLRQSYPKGRNTWNSALNSLKSYYSDSFNENSLNTSEVQSNSDLESQTLDENKDFFFLLTEYTYGKYPSSERDVLRRSAWIEKGHPENRMKAIVKATLKSNCRNYAEGVRTRLNPIFLPEKIDDCLKNQ